MKSIEVTLKLLEALAESEADISVLDIAGRIGFSKSTTHRALQILERERFAEKDPVTRRYRCGPRMLNIAFNFIASLDLRHLAHPILRRIVDEVNENAYLSLYAERALYFVDKIEASHPIRYINPMGRRPFLHAGAVGKVVLAFLAPGEIERFIEAGLPRFTPNTITEPERLRAELARIRRQGYAFSSGEFVPGGVAFAAPILNAAGVPIGCISTVIPEDRYHEGDRDRYVRLLTEGARELEDRLRRSGVEGWVPS